MSRDFGVPVVSQGEYCFISYNTEDCERVGTIVNALHDVGISIWYDKGIDYGSNYHKVIAERIDLCCSVLLFFSTKILEKGEWSYVYNEYQMAKLSKKPVFVVMLDEISYEEVPHTLKTWYIELSKLKNIQAYANTMKKTIQEIIDVVPINMKDDICESLNDYYLGKNQRNEKASESIDKDPGNESFQFNKGTKQFIEELSDNSSLKDENQKGFPKAKAVTKKKVLITIISLIFLVSASIMLWDIPTHMGTCGENLTWSLNRGVLTISGFGEMKDYYPNEVSKQMYAYRIEDNVTTLHFYIVPYQHSFKDHIPWSDLNVQKVFIDDGVTTIGTQSFLNQFELKEVSIPESVICIGGGAFSKCIGLNKISIPDSVLEIQQKAFIWNISLKEVTLSEKLEVIPELCFCGCTSLASILIPESVESIELYAFEYCVSLKEIKFTSNIPPKFGDACFEYVTATIYYPSDNDAWNQVVEDYYNYGYNNWNAGGQLTWVPY